MGSRDGLDGEHREMYGMSDGLALVLVGGFTGVHKIFKN